MNPTSQPYPRYTLAPGFFFSTQIGPGSSVESKCCFEPLQIPPSSPALLVGSDSVSSHSPIDDVHPLGLQMLPLLLSS